MTRSALCYCGHWSDDHQECVETACANEHGEAWHVVCTIRECGCIYFETDTLAMRDLENEAKQLEWDARRGK